MKLCHQCYRAAKHTNHATKLFYLYFLRAYRMLRFEIATGTFRWYSKNENLTIKIKQIEYTSGLHCASPKGKEKVYHPKN